MSKASNTDRVGSYGASVDSSRSPMPGAGPRVEGRAAGREGFTITELLVTLIILFLLITMLVVAVNRARDVARRSTDTQTVATLKIGVERFQDEFGFLPPLVKDNPDPSKYSDWDAPLDGNAPLDDEFNPVVFSTGDEDDLEFLRGGTSLGIGGGSEEKDYRFSEYTIPYYLMGALGRRPDDTLIDGVEGAGFRTPRRDGSFMSTGRIFEPFFQEARDGEGVIAVDSTEGRYELRDSNGVAFRYYRWEHGKPTTGEMTEFPEDYNVPGLIGDAFDDEALRGARWAIVAAGPNGVFGDQTEGGTGKAVDFWQSKLGRATNEQTLRRRAQDDNIVEIGR